MEAEVEYRQNRQGRIEKIVEAYAHKHGLGTTKEMLALWLANPPKGEGLDTYAIAERIGCTHQGVSYLCKKYGVEIEGRTQLSVVLAKIKGDGYVSLAQYFARNRKKTVKEQAEELGIGERTVKRYRHSYTKKDKRGGR